MYRLDGAISYCCLPKNCLVEQGVFKINFPQNQVKIYDPGRSEAN
jgi:hypothetical protein